VTRDPVETQGVQAQAARGDNGIQDSLVRLGWGNESGSYRITADRRADLGLAGAAGPARVHRLNVRGDVRASNVDTLEFRAGQAVIDAGVGFEGDTGNAQRTRSNTASFVQLDWRRSLGVNEDLSVQFSHTDERVRDDFPYTPLAGLTIDFGGRAASDNLSFQHTVRTSDRVRLLWGGELRRESIASRPLFNTDSAFVTDFTRVFGNIEWRLHRDLLLNAGGMYERSSLGGEHVAPRVMLNWHLAEGHTLRYGLTQAFRPPSTYEKYSNVRYYLNGVLQDSTDVSRGNVAAEKIQAREIGYLADFPQFGLNLDFRVFEEDVRGVVKRQEYSLPGSGGNGKAYDYINSEDFNAHGHEYQIRWQPWRSGHIFFSQTFVDSGQSLSGTFPTRPYAAMALMVMQQLPQEASLALTYSQVDASVFPGQNLQSPAMSRTDLRLAKAVRLGKQRGEVSLVVQNLGPAYPDFRSDFYFRRQAYLMLRLEN